MKHLRRLLACEAGAAFFEAALALPILILVFFGLVGLTQYALFRSRMESATIQVADAINQSQSAQGISKLRTNALPRVIWNSDHPTLLADMIVTMIYRPKMRNGVRCKPVAAWQWSGASDEANISRIAPGGKGTRAKSAYILGSQGDYVLAVEVFADFDFVSAVGDYPWFQNIVGNNYSSAYGRPRLGLLPDPTTGEKVKDEALPCLAE